jgi:undecaprenyl-diphosphatase
MKRLAFRFRMNPFLLAVFFFVLLFASSIAIGFLVNSLPLIQSFDRYFYELILNGPHPAWLNTLVSPFNFNFLPWFPVFESFLVLAVLLCLGVIFFRRRHDFGWAIFASGIAFIFDQGMAYLLPIIIYRQRPFIALPNQLSDAAKVIWSAWPSFPSGHTRDTAVFMTVLAAFMPKYLRWPMAIFAIFIAWTRIYVGAHYPTDVIAGLIIGYLIGKIALGIIEETRKLWDARKEHLPDPEKTKIA